MSRSRVRSLGLAGVLATLVTTHPAFADVPSAANSFYVPQIGPVESPTEGAAAIRFFRVCPNNDGGSSLPGNARIKVVVRNGVGGGIAGVPAGDVVVVLNGGTSAQGFTGIGADSIISNSQFNSTPLCPDIRTMQADAPTDATGTTYITFTGSDPLKPGVGVRNADRKWGHYDSELPVFVWGIKLSGRLTSGLANGTYTLRIKNFDWTGGLGTQPDLGERVTVEDFNGVVSGLGVTNAISYWKDFDSTDGVTVTDLNLLIQHMNHDCDSPNNP